jgi:Ser/Thr protein kinase RdoA (MazF antagonist)
VGVTATAVVGCFALPAGDVRVEPFAGGHINDSWLVTVGDVAPRRFLLQRVNEHVFPRPAEVMENVARVTAFAAAALARDGVADAERRALRLVPTADGAWWHVDAAGGHWRLLVFVEGTVTRDVARTADEAYETAHAFGRFLRLLGGLPGARLHEVIPGFHDTPRRVAALERSAAADRCGRRAGALPELDALLARRALAHALLDARDRGDAPERVVHNDAKIANVLLDARTGEGLCVVDLDTVMPGLALYDFGDMARSMASGAPEDERELARVAVRAELFGALARGFLDGAADSLGRAERGLLVTAARVITYEQAARFLADYLDGDRYYRTAPERPAHNLERARAQLALLESLERDERALARAAIA